MNQKKLKSKMVIKTLKNIILIMVTSIVLIFIFICFDIHKHEDLLSSKSLDSSYEIKVEYSSEDAWPFGPHSIYIYIKKDTKIFKSQLIETKLYNDGKIPDESNCTIEWNENIATVSLIGEEQDKEIININCEKRKIID